MRAKYNQTLSELRESRMNLQKTFKDGLDALDGAIQLLEVPLVYPGSRINIKVLKSEAEFVPVKSIVNIPSNKYLEVAKGVFDRLIESPTDIRYEEEKPFADYISKLDFENYYIIFVKSSKDGDFKLHHHDTLERLHCLKGGFIGISETGESLNIKVFYEK